MFSMKKKEKSLGFFWFEVLALAPFPRFFS
jgi:hypothetical protein